MNMQGTDASETSGLNLLSSRSLTQNIQRILNVTIFLLIAIE